MTAGLRYTEEKKNIERQLSFQALPDLPEFTTLIRPGTRAEETFTDTTPVLIAAYRFSDAVNAYAKYAEGFKSGGFNGEVAGGLTFGSDMALANAGALADPFVIGVDQLFEVGIGQHFFRQVAASSRDARIDHVSIPE